MLQEKEFFFALVNVKKRKKMLKTLGLMEILVILSRFPLYSTTRSPFSTLSVFLPLKFLPDSVRNWSFLTHTFLFCAPWSSLFCLFFFFFGQDPVIALGFISRILSRCLQGPKSPNAAETQRAEIWMTYFLGFWLVFVEFFVCFYQRADLETAQWLVVMIFILSWLQSCFLTKNEKLFLFLCLCH